MNILKNLNDSQIEAILYTNGPSIIIAGAGVGKTRVLTHKIAYLIAVEKVHSHHILALTFTNKSAKEMKERVKSILDNDELKVNVFTYHALCAKILRFDSHYLGITNQFNIIDVDDQRKIIKNIYQKGFDQKVDQSEIRLLASYISQWKNHKLTKADIIHDYHDLPEWLLRANVFEKYLEYQKNNACLDFDDLLLLVEKLFNEFPEVLAKWQSRFTHVLVDEFQDTNDLQYHILIALVKNHHNLTVVGDPDQTIYSWRGANINLILKFTERFSDAKTFILDQNYRSTTKILETANSLIQNNQQRIAKNLFTKNGIGEDIIIFHAINSMQEANWVANTIKKILVRQSLKLNNFAVLYRNNYLSKDLEQAFINYNLPYKIIGGFKFFERKEIKDILAYLKIIGWNDNLSTIRILGITPKIGAKTIDAFLQAAEQHQLPLIVYLEQYQYNLNKSHKESLQPLINLILEFKAMVPTITSVHQYVELLLKKSGYLQKLKDEFENDRIENVKKLLEQLVEYDANNSQFNGETLLTNFLQETSLYTTSDEENHNDAVNFMTIHSSKGLEFDIVFVVGINDGILPGGINKETLTVKEQAKLEEERRLFYVAITRAKKALFLSSADGFSYVLNRQIQPSRFFADLNEQHLKLIDNNSSIQRDEKIAQRFNRFNQTINNHHFNRKTSSEITKAIVVKWNVNDHLDHQIFGLGIVTKLIGDKIVVAFSQQNGGVKILSANHPAIKKVS